MDTIFFKNINILVYEHMIILKCEKDFDYFTLFTLFKHYGLQKLNIRRIYLIFYDEYDIYHKHVVKLAISESFSYENFTSLLTSTSQTSYQESGATQEKELYGIEIRYTNSTRKWFKKEQEVAAIAKKLTTWYK